MNPRPYEFYADGGWQFFAAAVTPHIRAAIERGEVQEVESLAKKPKSLRVLRGRRDVTTDGIPIDWGPDGNAEEVWGVRALQFFHCKAAFFQRMRRLHEAALEEDDPRDGP